MSMIKTVTAYAAGDGSLHASRLDAERRNFRNFFDQFDDLDLDDHQVEILWRKRESLYNFMRTTMGPQEANDAKA